MSEAWKDGYDAYEDGLEDFDNPWSNSIDGHDMHCDEYFDWYRGWWAAKDDQDASQTS